MKKNFVIQPKYWDYKLNEELRESYLKAKYRVRITDFLDDIHRVGNIRNIIDGKVITLKSKRDRWKQTELRIHQSNKTFVAHTIKRKTLVGFYGEYEEKVLNKFLVKYKWLTLKN